MLEIDQQINAGIGHRLAYHGHSVCAILPTESFEESVDLEFHDLTFKSEFLTNVELLKIGIKSFMHRVKLKIKSLFTSTNSRLLVNWGASF